jgi:hypothetical protein
MKLSIKKLALAVSILCSPFFALAWGYQGHRITGQIAESYLTPKARLAIKKILGYEPLAIAGNWPDFVRSDPNYKYMDPWHFVDFDRTMSQPEMTEFLEHDTNENAYTKLKFFVGELKKKNLSYTNKLMYLRLLVHLVEDIHQPMHTAPNGTDGGNKIKVQWFNDQTNLHTIWDSKLIDNQQFSYTEYAALINHTTAAQRAEWQKAPITKWVFESNEISTRAIAEVKPDQKLSYDYNFKYISTINQQLLKGGVRLAGLLNEIFG